MTVGNAAGGVPARVPDPVPDRAVAATHATPDNPIRLSRPGALAAGVPFGGITTRRIERGSTDMTRRIRTRERLEEGAIARCADRAHGFSGQRALAGAIRAASGVPSAPEAPRPQPGSGGTCGLNMP